MEETLVNLGFLRKSNYSKKVRKTAKIRNQYNQVPHLTQDTTWESDKITIRRHKQEPTLPLLIAKCMDRVWVSRKLGVNVTFTLMGIYKYQ